MMDVLCLEVVARVRIVMNVQSWKNIVLVKGDVLL